MLVKLTPKGQLTLPEEVIPDFQGYEYFNVTKENGRILLTPLRLTRAAAVRAKVAELNISRADVAAAVLLGAPSRTLTGQAMTRTRSMLR